MKYDLSHKYENYKRIFLISDLHFGVRGNSIEWLENQRGFFKNFYIPYLKKNVKPDDIVFIAGDFFDSRQLLDISVMNTAINVVTHLAAICNVYLMTGNHDIYAKNNTDVNSLAAFKFIPNVTIYEKPVIIYNGFSKILVLPWIASNEEQEGYLEHNIYDYVFAHADMMGFQYDNSQVISKGVDITKAKNLKRLFSGHIHKRQEMNRFIYIGSPYHTKRSDIGNEKGVYMLDPASNEIEFTPNKISPIFQRIHLNDLLELTLEQTKKILNNNYTDIIVPDKYIHLFNLTKFIDMLVGCEYKKIETIGEVKRTENTFLNPNNRIDIKDIPSLIDTSIEELGHQKDVLAKLKTLNRTYFDKASKDEVEN